MSNYIRNYLNQDKRTNKQDKDSHNQSKKTQQYLIAVPMETCHELALELESIQRAILYHCPILVHACVPAAALRVPLLKVETTVEHHNVKQLQACMDTVLQQPTLQQEPWMVSWKGLQGKDKDNSVLYATSNSVSPLVSVFVQQFNQTLQQQAPSKWTVSWVHHEELRLPFLQLPDTWETILQQEHNFTANHVDDDDDDDDNDQWRYALTSDQGGNGISPLFWIQYMEDSLGQDALRLPEIALYPSSADRTLNTWPCSTWPLPVGTNQTILRREQEFQNYQEERMQKAEQSLRRPTAPDDSKRKDNVEANYADDNEDNDMMLLKTRERLEQLYGQKSESEMNTISREAIELESNKDIIDDGFDDIIQPNKPETPQDPAILDGWMREKIQNIVASRSRERSLQQLSVKKDKPAIADNPIFAQYKNGTLVPETTTAPSPSTPALPPFPSREHLVGFWRMVRSPTGFELLEDASHQSERLILRIDGTTAGGPILDQETQQKASGGTWTLLGETADTARLRIRLVIPPKKERILVMEGALERVSTKGNDLPLASNTFGIPALEELKSRSDVEMEDFLFCGGRVWIEDATTGRNRDDIGKFSVMKLNLSNDPSKYTITVPRSVRNQD